MQQTTHTHPIGDCNIAPLSRATLLKDQASVSYQRRGGHSLQHSNQLVARQLHPVRISSLKESQSLILNFRAVMAKLGLND